jgi:tRNA dimethylallyltransferase
LNVPQNKTAFIICGPTAVGKTAVAIQIAKHLGTEIISADSRQCFKELKIGVARPSETELQAVPHHFIASHSVNEEITAVGFEQYALEKIEFLFKKHNVVVLVGGTGLYIKAFEEGLDLIPEIDVNVRREIVTNYEKLGISWLQQELKRKILFF